MFNIKNIIKYVLSHYYFPNYKRCSVITPDLAILVWGVYHKPHENVPILGS